MKFVRIIFLLFCLSLFGYQLLDEPLKSYKFYETEALVFILPAILTLYLIFRNNQILDSKEWKELDHLGLVSLIIYYFLFLNTLFLYAVGVDAVSGDTSEQQLVIMFSALFLIPALVRSTYFWKGRVKKRKLKEKQIAQEEKASKRRKKRKEKQKADKIAEEKKKIEIQKAVEKENRKIREAELEEKYGKEVSSAYRKGEICIGMPFSLVKEVLGQEYERKRTAKFTRYKFGRFYTREYDTKLEIDLTKVVNPFDISKKRLHYRFQVDFKDELCVDWEELDHPSNPEYSNRRITHK